MIVKNVDYYNYRNIEQSNITFEKGVNILWGDNAQGKTNALEGIYCFACGKSFRGAKDRELIFYEKDAGHIKMTFEDEEREQNLLLKLYRDKKREMKKNDIAVRSTADFVGIFHAVLFCPEHLFIVQGAPAIRRAFLDTAICQLRPTYLSSLTEYAKLLKQRNALLKDEKTEIKERMPLYEILTEQLAIVNTRIVQTRMKYVKLLNEAVDGFMRDMTGGAERTALVYQSDAKPEEYGSDAKEMTRYFYEKSLSYASREFAAEKTLHGCHKDDIDILLNERAAKTYASQGQSRSIALAMKLGEGDLSKTATGEYPVFLFDDVLSELDANRQGYLMKSLDERQVIITSCNEELFKGIDANLVHVTNGTYEA